jgi:hypothetical protein
VKAVVKVDRAASGDSEKQLKGFIDKFEPKHQALIRATRKALRKRLPVRTNWHTTTTTSSLWAIVRRNDLQIASSR